MTLPAFSMRELMEAGVHFGHKTKRWNPRMAPFIFGVRNDIHIIDLGKTVPMLHRALEAVRDVVANNGRVLFVGTKRQAQDQIAAAAKRCGQYYINQRWLGGLLTNWNTIQVSIKALRRLDEQLSAENQGFTKKELLTLQRQREKLENSLGGIKEMPGRPDMIVIIDTNKEDLAIKEAIRLSIPVVAVVDTNCSCDGITYPIPGNDDSTRAIRLYCQLISDAALAGIQQSVIASGSEAGARQQLGADVTEADFAAQKEKETEEKENNSGKRRGRNEAEGKKSAAPAKKAPTVTVKKKPGGRKTEESSDDGADQATDTAEA